MALYLKTNSKLGSRESRLHITPCIMVNSTDVHYPIHGPNACLPRKVTMCFEKSMKEYAGHTKLKTLLSGKPYYKGITGLS